MCHAIAAHNKKMKTHGKAFGVRFPQKTHSKGRTTITYPAKALCRAPKIARMHGRKKSLQCVYV
jgi:hypothetical protein